jgi:hypothetical protein
MCTTTGAVERVLEGLADLAEEEVTLLPDQRVRDEVLTLLAVANQVNAALLVRAAVFDARGLCEDDGFRTAKGWLAAFGRVGHHAAGSVVKKGRILRELPALAAAASRGDVSDEHLARVVRLAGEVGVVAVREFDPILADLAEAATPAELGVACERIKAHVDPDGPEPDPGADFARRGLTLSRRDGIIALKGQLDLEAGAALMTALDAVMRPPTSDDLRTPAQRRADALADLVRGVLAGGALPTVGGTRPQLGILIPAHTLPHQNDADPPALPTIVDPLAAAGVPPRAEPASMDWVGEIPTELARRIACDSDVWRVVLDPASGLPLDVGRAYRVAPHWIRKALHARDRGCRWPGCDAPAQWVDVHHLDHWIDGGRTDIARLLSLCRYHHGCVHEGGWTIHLEQTTGQVSVTRPDGHPYELAPSQPFTAAATRRPAA